MIMAEAIPWTNLKSIRATMLSLETKAMETRMYPISPATIKGFLPMRSEARPNQGRKMVRERANEPKIMPIWIPLCPKVVGIDRQQWNYDSNAGDRGEDGKKESQKDFFLGGRYHGKNSIFTLQHVDLFCFHCLFI